MKKDLKTGYRRTGRYYYTQHRVSVEKNKKDI